MENCLATVTLPHVSGFPDEDVVNTFAFRTAGAASAVSEAADIAGILPNFYNANQSTAANIAQYIGPGVKRTTNACTIRVYNLDGHLDGTPHGSPILTTPFTLGAETAGVLQLPEEVAIALTLRGQGWDLQPVEIPDSADAGTAPDRPRSRFSGRIYLGPLSAACYENVSGKARPKANFVTTVLDAAEDLYDAAELFSHAWGVWSRANAEITPLASCSMDDAFDTQRRRGVRPSVRTTRVVEP